MTPETARFTHAAMAELQRRNAALTAERDAAVAKVDAALAERDRALGWLKMAKSNTADYEHVVIAMGERRATAAIVAWLRGQFQADDAGGGDLAHWIADAIERGDHLTEAKPPQN